jgi:hypothetical protein
MKVLDILNYVLLLLLFTTSIALSDDVGDTIITQSGFGFDSSESISGLGFTSTHSCINADPEILQTRSSGSGSYSYDSTIKLLNFTATDPANGFIAAARSIEFQENTSFTYSPILLANKGTFRSGPIKSLWGDSIATGNGGGAYMKVGHDNTRALSKDVHTKVSGFEDVRNILSSSGEFDAGMKFNDAFTGNEKLDVWLKEPNKKIPTRLMDEYYSGTFRINKNLGLKVEGSISDYGETSEDINAINWLPCACNAGWDDMDLHDQRYHSAERFFNCSTCEQPKPCSNKLVRTLSL